MAHHFRDSYRHPDPRELRERHRPLGKRCERAVNRLRSEHIVWNLCVCEFVPMFTPACAGVRKSPHAFI